MPQQSDTANHGYSSLAAEGAAATKANLLSLKNSSSKQTDRLKTRHTKVVDEQINTLRVYSGSSGSPFGLLVVLHSAIRSARAWRAPTICLGAPVMSTCF